MVGQPIKPLGKGFSIFLLNLAPLDKQTLFPLGRVGREEGVESDPSFASILVRYVLHVNLGRPFFTSFGNVDEESLVQLFQSFRKTIQLDLVFNKKFLLGLRSRKLICKTFCRSTFVKGIPAFILFLFQIINPQRRNSLKVLPHGGMINWVRDIERDEFTKIFNRIFPINYLFRSQTRRLNRRTND